MSVYKELLHEKGVVDKGAPGFEPVTRGRGGGWVKISLKKFSIHASKMCF